MPIMGRAERELAGLAVAGGMTKFLAQERVAGRDAVPWIQVS